MKLIAFEKPIAMSMTEALEMQRLTRGGGVKTVVSHQHRVLRPQQQGADERDGGQAAGGDRRPVPALQRRQGLTDHVPGRVAAARVVVAPRLVEAREAGTTSSGLELLFQRSAHAAREARAHGDLAAAGRSIARVALDMADSRIPDWAEVPVLLVGTGSYAATTVAGLRARGATDIRVFSATGRAQ